MEKQNELDQNSKECLASVEACRKIREKHIGMDHPNIKNYDDEYVIRNYPFEWGLFMDGWKLGKNR